MPIIFQKKINIEKMTTHELTTATDFEDELQIIETQDTIVSSR